MKFYGTTVLGVRRDGKVAIGADGQVSLDTMIVKHNACKIRRLYQGKVLAGFAGSVADALALFERFEKKLEERRGNLQRATVELAKEWRTDKYLRRLEALLIVMDTEEGYLVSGSGEVVASEDGVLAIGSGAPYALASARALLKHSKLSARRIVEESLRIAASLCVFTNDEITVEEI